MRRAWSAVLLAAVVAAGCGDDRAGVNRGLRPVESCGHLEHAACDVRTPSCQRRLFDVATCLRGDQPGELPPISVVSEAAFAAMLADEAASRPLPEHLGTWDWAWASLALIAPGALTPSTAAAERAKWIWGVYRSDTKEVTLVDHGARFDDRSASPVLLHELIHALQDREVDLREVYESIEWSRDASLAARSIVEGEARMHETRYHAALEGYDLTAAELMTHFDAALDRDREALLMDESPLTSSAQRFPYQWGATYVHQLWRAGGMDAVHAVLQAPPTTTRVLMDSVDRAVPPEPTPAPPPAPTPPAEEWTEVGHDTLGAWALFLALAHLDATWSGAADTWARGWRADGFWLYERTGAGLGNAFVWTIDLVDEDTARDVAQWFQTKGTVQARAAGARLVFSKSSDGTPLDWAAP
jgi:hypothetical protein